MNCIQINENILFYRDNLDVLDDEIIISESDYKQKNDVFLMGSISHRFVDTTEYYQHNYYKLEMAEDKIIFLQV